MDLNNWMKYEKLLPHTTADEISRKSLELLKSFGKENKPAEDEIDLCIKLVNSQKHQLSYHHLTLDTYIQPIKMALPKCDKVNNETEEGKKDKCIFYYTPL